MGPLDEGLNKEDLSGDLLHSGILGYFASVDGADQLAARAGQQALAYRLPSYGVFSATPSYYFGIVQSVALPGVEMDVDRLAYAAEAKATTLQSASPSSGRWARPPPPSNTRCRNGCLPTPTWPRTIPANPKASQRSKPSPSPQEKGRRSTP